MSFTAFGPIYKATAALLPAKLDSTEAKAALFANAMQESRLDERRQIGGPARGFWQFEKGTPASRGGITGILMHDKAGPLIKSVLDRLDYDHTPETSYTAIEHNDVLAFAYARCLLWTFPTPLAQRNNAAGGWEQYVQTWRPGKPHRHTWDACWQKAWAFIDQGEAP